MSKCLKDLKVNPKNPRIASDEKIEMLKKSMMEFGDLSGIVYNRTTQMLVGGHQRKKIIPAEAKVTITKTFEKPTKTGTLAEGYIEFEGERFKYREVKWDETKEKAANIAANKGAGEWDLSALSDWMKDLDSFGFDLNLTMFDQGERESLFTEVTTGSTPDEVKDEEVPAAPKVAKTKKGDIYVLGKHRLLCGDSTSLDDFEKLMAGKRADLTFTSPPYNANTKFSNTKNNGALYENYSDDLPSDDYVRFAGTVLTNCIAHTREYCFWNVNYNTNARSEWIKQILPHIDLLDETIAWKKTALPVPHGLTRTWEPIFVFRCHKDKKRIGHANVTEFNYWEISNANALDDSHRAAFPVALPLKAFEIAPDCKSVLDPFGGSGTTMIAAEKTGRSCFMLELDPIYCDVIVARWEKFTGQKAKLLPRNAPK